MRIAFKIKTRINGIRAPQITFAAHHAYANFFFVYAKDFSSFVYAFFPIAYRPLLIGKSSS